MTFKRWLPTFLAFPLGGLIAIESVGSLHDPASAAAGGLIVGALVGAAQGLALGSRRWAAYTAGAVAAGASRRPGRASPPGAGRSAGWSRRT